MPCPKCKGLMVLERFSDFFLAFYGWKCINCGAIVDKTIATNRGNSRQGVMMPVGRNIMQVRGVAS